MNSEYQKLVKLHLEKKVIMKKEYTPIDYLMSAALYGPYMNYPVSQTKDEKDIDRSFRKGVRLITNLIHENKIDEETGRELLYYLSSIYFDNKINYKIEKYLNRNMKKLNFMSSYKEMK